MLTERKGVVLITVYIIIAILLILGATFVRKNIWESKAAQRYKDNLSAFYLAEAAIDQAIAKLPSDISNETAVALGDGQYSLVINQQVAGKQWTATGYGYIPTVGSPRVTRVVEAFLKKKDLPDNFWDNAIYTAGNITLNGNTYQVNGNVTYAGAINDTDYVTGDVDYDPSARPLAKFDFDYLRNIAISQIKADGSDNLYTALEIQSGTPPLPASFWFDEPAGIPNVVYVETDLILNGNVGTFGGFLLVVGDVVTNPAGTNEFIINGTGQIDGCIYTTGQFRVNGGGGGLNVFGGVWSGSDGARLNGNANVTYHKDYMDAIRYNLNPTTEVQLVSWREVR
ncbi:MAG: hypothetical protein ABH952_10165 [Candidatus Omnitrophota bacterium]